MAGARGQATPNGTRSDAPAGRARLRKSTRTLLGSGSTTDGLCATSAARSGSSSTACRRVRGGSNRSPRRSSNSASRPLPPAAGSSPAGRRRPPPRWGPSGLLVSEGEVDLGQPNEDYRDVHDQAHPLKLPLRRFSHEHQSFRVSSTGAHRVDGSCSMSSPRWRSSNATSSVNGHMRVSRPRELEVGPVAGYLGCPRTRSGLLGGCTSSRT